MPILMKGNGNRHLPLNPTNERTASPVPSLRPAVFLDRDGVLVEDVGFLSSPADLRILPGVAQALRSLAPQFLLVVATNQSGIARGLFTEDDLLAIHEELARQLLDEGVAIDAFYYCPHHPNGSVPAYRISCECRKPKPGMLRQASHALAISMNGSYMVGDNRRDVVAGVAAGAQGVAIGESQTGYPGTVIFSSNLLDASGTILERHLSLDAPPINQAVPSSLSPAISQHGGKA